MNIKIKKVTVFLFLTLISTTELPAQQMSMTEKITLAVMDFKNNTSIFGYDRLEQAVPEMLKTELSRYPEILVVERSKIESILAEQALAQAGVIEEKTAQEVGRLAGAEYIVTGEINTINSQLRIDAHLIKVVTGQVIGEKISGKDRERIEPMVRLLAQNLIVNLTGKGERKQCARIRDYGHIWGLLTTGTFAMATVITHFKYKNSYNKYHNNNQLYQFDRYYNDANKYYKVRNGLLTISGALAVTTFILWRNEVSEANKIYAAGNFQSLPHQFPKYLAIGFQTKHGDYLVSLSYRF